MSWYTIYYLGIMDKDGKITPLGPYDNNLNLRCVRCTSRSFTTDLKDYFRPITKEMLTDKLRMEFPHEVEDADKEDGQIYQYFEYSPLDKLPKGEWVKSGYFLIEDIQAYLKYKNGEEDYFEGFFYELTPFEYTLKLENEIKFGKPEPKHDSEENELVCYSCADYAYFAYPDYSSMEYEAFLLRATANMLMDDYQVPKGSQIVAIKTEG